MYTYSDLYDICMLYYLQACAAYCYHADAGNKPQTRKHGLRCLLYAVSAEMIYEGRY